MAYKSWYTVKDNVVDFSCKDFKKLHPLEAAKQTVELILKEYEPPYHIMVSGGIDSQAMLYSWIKFGKKFIPTTVIYNDLLNYHDIQNIEKFCQIYNINLIYKYFDLLYFLENEYDAFSTLYQCSSPCISTHIKMAEDLKGTAIFSGNSLGPKGTHLSQAILGIYRASLVKSNLIPFFFLHTPELAYSFNNIVPDKETGEYIEGVERYRVNGFPVIPQKEKISGFEKVKDLYDKKYKVSPKDRIKYHNKLSKRTFDIMLRYPYETQYNDRQLKFVVTKTK